MQRDSIQYQNLISRIRLKNKFEIRGNIIKIIFWYIAINLALLLTIFIVLKDFLINNATYILGFSSIVSLTILLSSKALIKRTYEMRRITEASIASEAEYKLYELVKVIFEKYGLDIMPEIYIYKSEEVNAFATGRSKNHSLVAFSDSIIKQLNEEALAAVIGHEISHIVNGDMTTMCILTGVICTILILVSIPLLPLLVFIITDDSIGRAIYNIGAFILLIASFLVTFVSNFFSRHREYKADKGSAELLGKEVMIKALKEIQSSYIESDNTNLVNSFKIHNECKYFDILSTHPSIEKRIKRLSDMIN